MGKKSVGKAAYSPQALTRAFDYFMTSRSLYNKLIDDYALPSVRTLTRITSKTNKVEDTKFLKSVLENLPHQQRKCIILIDEVYIKPSLTYHGGQLFGRAVNNPEKLASTVCTIMIKCAFGSPEFVFKALPVSNLTSQFLIEQCNPLIQAITEVENANLLAIITDGHRINQKFFQELKAEERQEPWHGPHGATLAFDYVHIVKCVRNNWLTEKCQQLKFEYEGQSYIVDWQHLKLLFVSESDNLLRLSKLSYEAIFPKPIKRQKVSTCLRVFCDETMAALETYSTIHSIDARGTTLFLKLIIRFWKIVNVQSPGADIRYKDNDRQVVRSVNDPSLLFLSELAHLVEGMKPENRKTRMHQLTYDTASIMAHTCRALVSLATNMLTSGQSFVILGWFSTDPLEKCFSKLRQGAGGTYFISARSVLEKINIQCANTALNLELACINEATDGHYCEFCERTPSEAEILDNLTELEQNITISTKKCNGIHIWLYSTPSWCNRCR